LVIGSSGIYDKGWIPSEEHFLNLLDENSWKRYFDENEINSLLAEHVWEHLTAEQGIIAAKLCYKYMKKGGYLRVAVPDGFHNKQEYIDYVKPGGHGAGADDHKLLYNYKSFSSVFSETGFQINLLEYFDEDGEFHFNDWNIGMGKIHRSIRYDGRNKDGKPNYTSIILDAHKV
jgi:predicted SAM-dependent methyltransferase